VNGLIQYIYTKQITGYKSLSFYFSLIEHSDKYDNHVFLSLLMRGLMCRIAKMNQKDLIYELLPVIQYLRNIKLFGVIITTIRHKVPLDFMIKYRELFDDYMIRTSNLTRCKHSIGKTLKRCDQINCIVKSIKKRCQGSDKFKKKDLILLCDTISKKVTSSKKELSRIEFPRTPFITSKSFYEPRDKDCKELLYEGQIFCDIKVLSPPKDMDEFNKRLIQYNSKREKRIKLFELGTISGYTEAIHLYYEALNLIGFIYYKKFEFYMSKLQIEMGDKINIYKKKCCINLRKIAECCFHLGLLDEGILRCKEALDIEPSSWFPLAIMSCIYQKKKSYDEARTYYSRARDIKGESEILDKISTSLEKIKIGLNVNKLH